MTRIHDNCFLSTKVKLLSLRDKSMLPNLATLYTANTNCYSMGLLPHQMSLIVVVAN